MMVLGDCIRSFLGILVSVCIWDQNQTPPQMYVPGTSIASLWTSRQEKANVLLGRVWNARALHNYLRHVHFCTFHVDTCRDVVQCWCVLLRQFLALQYCSVVCAR